MNAFKRATIKILDRTLPSSLKNSLFHLSFHLAKSEFDQFAYRYCFAPNMFLGLNALGNRGFTPRTIVDVGAFEGNWSKLTKRIWPSSQLFMIEPNVEKKDLLLKIAKGSQCNFFLRTAGCREWPGSPIPHHGIGVINHGGA